MPLKPGRRQRVRQRDDTDSGQESGVTGAPSTGGDRTERQGGAYGHGPASRRARPPPGQESATGPNDKKAR